MSHKTLNINGYFIVSCTILLGYLTPAFSEDSTPAAAIPSVVVTASRYEEPIEETASSITVISNREIKQRGYLTVEETLKDITGLKISTLGTMGESTTVSIRGSNKNQVLLLIDGVKINSPIDQTPNFDNLLVDNIERVEVVRGSQSSLYGSEAMGGVVNIITKKQYNNELHISDSAGNLGTHRDYVFGSFKNNNSDGFLSYSLTNTNGQYEHDTFLAHTASGKFNLLLSDKTSFSYTNRYIQSEKELSVFCCDFSDAENGNIVLTKDDDAKLNKMVIFNLLSSTYLLKENIEYSLDISRTDYEVEMVNDSDKYNTITEKSKASGYRNIAALQQNISFNNFNFIFGVEHEKESITKDETSNLSSMGLGTVETLPKFDNYRENSSIYYQGNILVNKISSSLGVRHDNNSQFGNETSPRVSVSYRPISSLSFRGSWGQGIRAPSFDEAYGSAQGNDSLSPEKNTSYEIGFEQKIKNSFSFSSNYFNSEYQDMISISPDPNNPKLVNINEASTSGVESSLSFDIFSNLKLIGNHTYLYTKDKQTDQELAFRPKNSYNFIIDFHIDRLNSSIVLNKVDASHLPSNFSMLRDLDGEFFGEENPGYTVVDLSISYQPKIIRLNDKINTSLKINNLFNENYEQTRGFQSPGINFLAKLDYKI